MTHPKDLSALWREREAAYAAVNSALEPEDDPAWQRYSAVDAAIRAARPMSLSGIAVQARLLQDSITHGAIDQDADLARSIAEQLEQLAKPPPA
jgi:hypothetical protein